MIQKVFQQRMGAAGAALLWGLASFLTSFGGLTAVGSAAADSPNAVLSRSIVRTPNVIGLPPGYPAGERVLDQTDAALFADAFAAVKSRDWSRAQALGERMRHPIGATFVTWARLAHKDTDPGFEEIMAFLEAKPDWPSQDTMLKKAEDALPESMPPQQLIAWFAGQEPLTGEGKIRLGKSLIATGQVEYGTAWVRRAFAEDDFKGPRLREIHSELSAYLDQETIDKRLARLLWTSQNVQAEWVLQHSSPSLRAVARTRIAYQRSASNATALAANLSADQRMDPGVLYDEVRYLRRRGSNEEAQRILAEIVKDRIVPYPERWWVERHVQVRKAIKERNYKTAYAIAANHGMSRGGPFSEAAFLAGWLALRHLSDADAAYDHFKALEQGVGFPISLARARYWQGRAAAAKGDAAQAQADYTRATEFPFTFYGQLAAEAAPMANSALSLPLGPQVTVGPQAPFFRSELVSAVRALHQIEADRYIRTIAYHLANEAETQAELSIIAELMRRLDEESVAVRVAKRASQRHYLLTDYLYPILELPAYRGRGVSPEPALVLGLSRQESEFNPKAVSSAGARGLMQLMPGTAKITARKHGLPYSVSRLTSDPTYNMQIGMAHLGDLLERFDGSYIMIIAGYNAGPNRVDQWVRDYGDPRTSAVDPIDWIETIPFRETRNYVQRVLENVMVYRHRLVGQPVPFMVSTDLRRTTATPPVSYAQLAREGAERADANPTASEPAQGSPEPGETPQSEPNAFAADTEPKPQPAQQETKAKPIRTASLLSVTGSRRAVPQIAPAAEKAVETGAEPGAETVARPMSDPAAAPERPSPQQPQSEPSAPIPSPPVSNDTDYLPPSGRVFPSVPTQTATPDPEAIGAGGTTAANQGSVIATQPVVEPGDLAPQNSSSAQTVDEDAPAPGQDWKIPLDCARYVIDASGVGRCMD